MPATFLQHNGSQIRAALTAAVTHLASGSNPRVTHATPDTRVARDALRDEAPSWFRRLLTLLPCADCCGSARAVDEQDEEREPLLVEHANDEPQESVTTGPADGTTDTPPAPGNPQQPELTISSDRRLPSMPPKRPLTASNMERSGSGGLQVNMKPRSSIIATTGDASFNAAQRRQINADLLRGIQIVDRDGVKLLEWRLKASSSSSDAVQLNATEYAATPLANELKADLELSTYFNREFTMGQVRFGAANAMVDGKLVVDQNNPAAAIEAIRMAKRSAHFNRDDVEIMRQPDSGTEIQGSEKTLYRIKDNNALTIALLGERKSRSVLIKEIRDLNKLRDFGLPVVRHYGLVHVGGRPGILMDYVADARPSSDMDSTRNLNRNTIDDLKKIKGILQEQHICIKDFQFLIGVDGHVHIIDPQDCEHGDPRSNIDLVDKMLALAERAPAA